MSKVKKIKILHVVVDMGLGGYENYIMNIFRHIDRNIYQFDFLVFKKRKCFFEDEILSLGGKVHHLSFSGDFNYIRAKKMLKQFAKNNHYDIAHCHNRYYSFLYMPSLKKCCDKIIMHSHTANREKTLKGFIVWILGEINANKTPYKLACSKLAGDFVFGKRANYVICPNCIETEKFAFDEVAREELRDHYGLNKNNIVIGHIGRFAPVKNHKLLLKSFKDAYLKNSNLRLCLCGVGALKNKYIKTVNADETLRKSVIFLETGDVSKYYSMFDCFALPSFHEGFPLSLLEAQASGCVSLVSNSVTNEVKLTDKVHYLGIKNSEDWSNAFLNIEVNYKNRLSYNSKICESKYDIRNAVLFLTNYYNQILNQ